MTLTKDSTKEEFEKEIRELYSDAPPEREWIIYAPPEFWEAFDKAVDEEIKILTGK